VLAQFDNIILPTGVDPVKDTFLIVGCSHIPFPIKGVFVLEVVKTLIQPSGKPAFSANY
jgi:hypothetical protein